MFWEITWAIPQTRFDHGGRHIFGDGMGRGKAFRRKACAACLAPHGGNCNGGIGGTECGGSRFGNTPPRRICQQGQRRHVGIFALICRHPLGGVAFHMFDRAEVFLGRLFDILYSHIVLIIQPRPRLARNGP